MQAIIDIDDALMADIDRAANVQRISRTEAFEKALRAWVSTQPRSKQWSIDFSSWPSDPDFIPFEADRPGPEALPPDPFSRAR